MSVSLSLSDQLSEKLSEAVKLSEALPLESVPLSEALEVSVPLAVRVFLVEPLVTPPLVEDEVVTDSLNLSEERALLVN